MTEILLIDEDEVRATALADTLREQGLAVTATSSLPVPE